MLARDSVTPQFVVLGEILLDDLLAFQLKRTNNPCDIVIFL